MVNPGWNKYGGEPERNVGVADERAAKRKKQQDRAEVRAACEAVDRRKAEIAAQLKSSEEE